MSKQTISIGSTANDHTGDPLRTAFSKVNSNFTELYTAVNTIPTDINQLSDVDSLLGQDNSFNIGTVDLHNGGVQTGQILQFTDNTYQSIVTGPAPSGVDVSAQRVIIQGQRATGQGEGGDVYLWGGDSDVNGGDIKIYAGDADSNSVGQGGYIHLTSGTGYDQGGNLTLQGGSSTTNGGDLYLSSGYGGVNHGQVFLNSGGSQWTFGKTGDLSLPVNGGIVFDRNNTSIKVGMGFHISSGEGVSIEAIDQTDPNNLIYKGWYFGTDGKLTSPNGLSLINNTIEGVAQNQIGTQWAYATNYLGGSDNQGSQGVNLAVNAETLALLTTWESNNVIPWTMQFSGESPVEVVSMTNYGDRIQVSTSVATFRSLPVVITSGDYQDSTPATVVLKAATKSLVFGDDGKLTLPTNGTINYTPTTPADWAGTAPTTIQEALDRLAASIKLLNSTGA